MRYQGLVGLVPNEILVEFVQLAGNCTKPDTALADCIEQEALSLALKGSIVAKGLTGMTTVDDDSCLPSFENDTAAGICRDGTGTEEYDDYASDRGYGSSGYGSSGAYNSGATLPKLTIVLCFWLMLIKVLF
jgi:hypothetical protein